MPYLAPQSLSETDGARLDSVTVEIVQGINDLLFKAQTNRLSAVSAILEHARVSISWWAACDDYKESKTEKLVQQLSIHNGLYVAISFLSKLLTVKDQDLKEDLLKMIASLQQKSEPEK